LKRFNLEERKAESEYETEQRKLDMQAEELKVNAEDSRRKVELQAAQLEVQRSMYALFKGFVPK